MDDLLADFIAETRETLDALSGEIVAWEAAPQDRSRLDAIFRFVHTVKGSCGFLDLPRLERLSHAAEDVLGDVRAERRKPDAKLVTAVLAIIDRIAELTNAIESGHAVPDGEDQVLIANLAEKSETVDATPTTTTAVATRTVSRSIRLPVDLLDRMMAGVSDMVLARNELSRKLRDSGSDASIDLAFERLSGCIAEMRDAITRTRMARIEHLFSALPRVVRDLASELDKLVSLEIDGGDVELDREMIEMIRDPLTHIVRNAVDHGLESAFERQAAGKPIMGRLFVSARQAGNQILIEIIDDGRGIDAERVVQKALSAGIITPDRAEGMSWERKLELIFEPGLSTAQQVTSISGRGVGMDVVRANVERIGGLVEVESRPGLGVRLTLRVPLTLTIIPALTVSCGDQFFAIPRSAIEEIVRVASETVRIGTVGGAQIAFIRGQRFPVVRLGDIIDAPEPVGRPNLVVLKLAGGNRYALLVDAVHDHEELVVKPASPVVMACGIYGGTTLPDNSRPMLLLDVAGIAEAAGVEMMQGVTEAEEPEVSDDEDAFVPTLMFRDLDGAERAIRLALVERIEDVWADAISLSAGRMRLTHDGRMIPLLTCGAPIMASKVRVLRISDGEQDFAYAIDSVVDIVAFGGEIEPAVTPGLISGVALIEERPVEFLDAFWLFAESSAERAISGDRLLCLLPTDDPWTRQVLAPLVESAGYQVIYPNGDAPMLADVTIVTDHQPDIVGRSSGAILHLRSSADPIGAPEDSIWRYDRSALTNSLRKLRSERKAG